MTITARYPGKCAKCGGSISAGDKIKWDKATRRTEHVECPANAAPAAPAKPVERPMTAMYDGTCAKCHRSFPAGAAIIWNRTTRQAWHTSCPAVDTDDATNTTDAPCAPYTISGGEGYGYRGWEPGQLVRTNERQQTQTGYPEWLTVVRAGRTYYREDGMSFGVGDESGYVYWADCREATPEEAAPGIARVEAAKAKEQAKAELATIERTIRTDGEQPEGMHSPEGERLMDTMTPYGGGAWYVIGTNHIWYVQNNGMSGDTWARNNVRTGGAGAIGWRVPHTPELETTLRRIAGIIG